jgi:hypothetical protein
VKGMPARRGEGSWPGPAEEWRWEGTDAAPEPGDAQPRYDEDTRGRFFALTPEGLALARTVSGPRNRLGLALLLAWTWAERQAVC